MIPPELVRRLRRTGAWTIAQSVHRRISPPVCAGIHALVTAAWPRVLPADLVLKHVYDYQVVYVDPRLVTRSLKVGEWHRREPGRPLSRWARFRKWQRLGGGWKTARRHVTRNLHGYFVVDGDWDLRTRPFELHPVIIELFREGRPPDETTEYQRLRGFIETGRFEWTRGCRTIEELDQYYADLVTAFEAIRDEGYLTQTELGNDGSDEIRVCIDRNGRVCVFGGGTHRLAIALVLEVERVPVLVKRVHAAWVAQWVERTGADVVTSLHCGVRDLESQRAVSSPG